MLTQADIRLIWDHIKPGLQEIKNQADPDWRPEDIYAAVLNGVAEIYIDVEQDPCESFIILQEKPNIFNASKSLLIWIAYDKRGKAAEKYMDYIEEMAKNKGCNKIEFWTPWESLAKALGYHGYIIKNYLTEKEI